MVRANGCKPAGCPDLLFHDPRPTSARDWRRKGITETAIMSQAGWNQLNIPVAGDRGRRGPTLRNGREKNRCISNTAEEKQKTCACNSVL